MRVARIVLATISGDPLRRHAQAKLEPVVPTRPGPRGSSSIRPGTTRKPCPVSTRCSPATAAISRS